MQYKYSQFLVNRILKFEKICVTITMYDINSISFGKNAFLKSKLLNAAELERR